MSTFGEMSELFSLYGTNCYKVLEHGHCDHLTSHSAFMYYFRNKILIKPYIISPLLTLISLLYVSSEMISILFPSAVGPLLCGSVCNNPNAVSLIVDAVFIHVTCTDYASMTCSHSTRTFFNATRQSCDNGMLISTCSFTVCLISSHYSSKYRARSLSVVNISSPLVMI